MIKEIKMPIRENTRLEDLFIEDSDDQGDAKIEKAAKQVLAIAEPRLDFLTGSQLADNEEALLAARKVVEKDVKSRYPEHTISWRGTAGRIMDGNGEVADRTEIHGANWYREKGEVNGVRFDVSGIPAHEEKRKEAEENDEEE